VFLLDLGYKEFKKHYPGIYQNFDKDIYSLLTKHKHLVSKYQRLFLIVPKSYDAKDIISGFKRFGKTGIIEISVIHDIGSTRMQKGDAFIIIDDNDLVELIKYAKAGSWVPGQDIGFLSYNETNLKSVVGNGVSTISSDYTSMGKSIAEMLLTNERRVVENPFMMIDRQSF
jgi:hypothetical protein